MPFVLTPLSVQILDRACNLENTFHVHPNGSAASQLNSSVKLEVFRKGSRSEDSFHERAATEAPSGVDDRLDGVRMFHFLKIGESCRLRIAIRQDQNARDRILGISSVRLKAPDSEPVELEKQMTANSDGIYEVVAIMDPARIRSDRLRSPSPVFGPADQMYVRLELYLEFATQSDIYDHKLELNRVVHCKMVRPQSRLLVHRLTKSFWRRWRTTPRRARNTAHSATSRAKVGAVAI